MIRINGTPHLRAIDNPSSGTYVSVKHCNEISDHVKEFFAKRGIELQFAGPFKYDRRAKP